MNVSVLLILAVAAASPVEPPVATVDGVAISPGELAARRLRPRRPRRAGDRRRA